MRFQLPAADKLRNSAVEHEGIEKIDVIRHEEGGPVGIEARRAAHFDAYAGEKCDAAAEAALEPIVFVGIEENAEKNEHRHNYKKMQAAEDPENPASENQPGPLHI